MELRHLKYFVAVAEELNFSRAAERLKISQPPLSQQIHQLENELGVQLFFRTKRQVELTDAGKAFLESTYKILSNIEKACETARHSQKGEFGKIAIGFTGTATFDILPNLMQSYRTRYPFVDLTVCQINTTNQVQSLLKSEIDIGILCSPVTSPDLEFAVIRKEPFIVALPENHPLASKTDLLEVQELSSELFIMTPRKAGQIYYDMVIGVCYNAGFSPIITQEVHELHTALSLVSACMGIALVPCSIQNFRINGIVYRQLKNSTSTLKTALVWRKDETAPIVHNFLNLAKEIFTLT
jgi:DNA-binding transcriptional LysR family regulator